jgi:hypothetical protein
MAVLRNRFAIRRLADIITRSAPLIPPLARSLPLVGSGHLLNGPQPMGAEDATRFEFLTTDGLIAVRFTPSIPQEAYSELLGIVKEPATSNELGDRLGEFANRWDVSLIVDK